MSDNNNSQNNGAQGAEPQVPSLEQVVSSIEGGNEAFQTPNIVGQDGKDDAAAAVAAEAERLKKEKQNNVGLPEGAVPFVPNVSGNDTAQEDIDVSEEIQTLFSNLYSDDEETQETRNTLLSSFNGKTFNENGDVIGEDNQVILTKNDLINYLELNELPTDENGNQVDRQGNILRTAEEIAQQNSIVYSTKTALETELGLEFVDAQGEPLSYPDTEEGITAMVKDAIAQKSGNAIRSFLDNNPAIKDVYQHLRLGGTMDTYKNDSVDYRAINVTNLSTEAKLNLVKQSLAAQGIKNPENFADLVAKAGEERITQEAANAVLTLDEIQKETKVQREQQIQQQEEQRRIEIEEYWTNTKKIIDKGTLKDISIPVGEREAFFNYLAKPVDNQNRSADMIKEDTESEDFKLMVAYLRYKDYDLSKLAKTMARQERVQTLREKASRGQQKVTSEQPRNTTTSTKPFLPSLSKLGI